MSTPFEITSFEEYLTTVRNELPEGRKYYRGQSKLAREGYTLKPSVGRFDHVKELSFFEREKLERDVLDVFSNHLLTYVHHLPRSEWEALAIAAHHRVPTRFMDWTTNPLVALYFAARETARNERDAPMDGAVYVLISDPRRFADLKRDQQPTITPIPDSFTKASDEHDTTFDDYPENFKDEPESYPQPPATQEVRTSVGEITEIGSAVSTVPSPFEIKENVIYDPPHVSPRVRAQDSVLLACHQPLEELEEKDYLEIVIKHDAHDDIRRRLDQYGVFDKQLFPDLDGIAKWLTYRVFEIKGTL